LIKGVALVANERRLLVGFVAGVTSDFLVAEVSVEAAGMHRAFLSQLVIASMAADASLCGSAFLRKGSTVAVIAVQFL
jgi:hypothetical protein